MVGSDCSFIFCFSRLANTAATRVRSSGLPVSFSMMDARTTSWSGVLSGRSGLRRSHTSRTSLSCACRMRWIICSREKPRDDLLRRQALGNGDLVLHHLAVDNRLHHLAHAGMLREEILARLELGA